MKLSMSKAKQTKRFDFILAGILVALFLASICAIYAAFPTLPASQNPIELLAKQVIFYCLGFVVVGVIMYFGNDQLFGLAKIGYFIFLGLLLYLAVDLGLQHTIGSVGKNVLPFANSVNGATCWFQFPVFGTLQPSEFMKVFLIIISAYVIMEHNEEKEFDTFQSDILLFIKVGKWLALPLILIFIQPDTGIPLIIVGSVALMLACSGIRKEWVIGVVLIVLVALAVFFYMFYFDQKTFNHFFPKSDYKVRRIYGWLYPEENASGDGMQLYSALLAMGSSGLTGSGVTTSVINILEGQTDFIFAVIGMSYGFIGSAITIGLCVALDARISIIAFRTKNNVEKLMLIGFVGMLAIQQVENIGMVIGFLPISGITLPMISAGGSSVLSYMIAFGIIMNTSQRMTKF